MSEEAEGFQDGGDAGIDFGMTVRSGDLVEGMQPDLAKGMTAQAITAQVVVPSQPSDASASARPAAQPAGSGQATES